MNLAWLIEQAEASTLSYSPLGALYNMRPPNSQQQNQSAPRPISEQPAGAIEAIGAIGAIGTSEPETIKTPSQKPTWNPVEPVAPPSMQHGKNGPVPPQFQTDYWRARECVLHCGR